MKKILLLLCLSAAVVYSSGNLQNDTLAVIGNKVISFTDFIKSYKDRILRLGLTDNGDTRFKLCLSNTSSALKIVNFL